MCVCVCVSVCLSVCLSVCVSVCSRAVQVCYFHVHWLCVFVFQSRPSVIPPCNIGSVFQSRPSVIPPCALVLCVPEPSRCNASMYICSVCQSLCVPEPSKFNTSMCIGSVCFCVSQSRPSVIPPCSSPWYNRTGLTGRKTPSYLPPCTWVLCVCACSRAVQM